MTDTYSDKYWEEEFTVTIADLDRFYERIRQDNKTFDITSLVKLLIKGRLEFGHEVSPTVLKSWTGKDSVRIWDPLAKWTIGDGVIVPKSVGSGCDDYECFVGEVISFEIRLDKTKSDNINIRLDGQDEPVVYKYDRLSTSNVHQFTKNLAEKKYEKVEGVEGIFARFGNRIVSALLHALESDGRFVGLEGKWYLVRKLPVVEPGILKSIHHNLLQRDSFTLNDLLPMVQIEGLQNETFRKMAIQIALQQLPERFENIGTSIRPLWKAIPPLPDQAKAIYYAYDPKSYEVLCSPGNRLDQKAAQRLQELNIYNQMVTFAE